MKKLLLITCSILAATCVFAENSREMDAIHLIKSKNTVEFKRNMTIGVTIDFSKAEIVNFKDDHHTIDHNAGGIESYLKSRGEDYWENWPKNLEMMTAYTCKRLHKGYGATFLPQNKVNKPDYRMVIKITLFDFGHFVMLGGTKVGGTITKGTVEIYDSKGTLAAVYDMNYIRGLNIAYGHNKRLEEWSIKYVQRLKEALPPSTEK